MSNLATPHAQAPLKLVLSAPDAMGTEPAIFRLEPGAQVGLSIRPCSSKQPMVLPVATASPFKLISGCGCMGTFLAGRWRYPRVCCRQKTAQTSRKTEKEEDRFSQQNRALTCPSEEEVTSGTRKNRKTHQEERVARHFFLNLYRKTRILNERSD